MRSLNSILKSIYGKISWGVRWDRQLNMDISFGDPVMKIREPYKSKRLRERADFRSVTIEGKWWLWIFCAHWNLRINDKCMATGASSHKRKQIAMNRLSGQKIVSIKVHPNNGSTEFEFDLGATLRVRRFENDDSVIWTLHFPNGMALGIMSNGTFTYQNGSTPVEKMIPRSLTIA
jgi:hypothetical protein